MPTYVYRSESGLVIEQIFPIGQAPQRLKLGETVYHRQIVGGHIATGKMARDRNWPIASAALPRNLPGFQTDRQGKPIIRSRRAAKNAAKRSGLEWD